MDGVDAASFPARAITSNDGHVVVVRPLTRADAEGFGEFLEGLSAQTRKRYKPHPLTRAYAKEVCSGLDEETRSLRIVLAEDVDGQVVGDIVGYMLVQFEIPQDEKGRYTDQGIVLDDDKDCRIAPAVADHLQNRGLGTILLKDTLAFLRSSGRRIVVLFGGTQASNARAIRAYEKAGFAAAGAFRTGLIDNVDMWLSLDTWTPDGDARP
ncbi:GNAT family N-acetyltransferase [Streptomyces sp. NPDC058964]|uniref:GNAT family N-acetyltransferase n=1 Tax=Streptomyces sp. NPDC058964 TaxID=3346681 RepID=UPI0036C4300D